MVESRDDTLRYIEFYAGVGGWTMALHEGLANLEDEEEASHFRLQICAALDHSDLCNDVYQHNFSLPLPKSNNRNKKKKAHKTVRIEQLTLQQLIDYQADCWLMSPPCQPHTRQHSNQRQDLEDARSSSFLHLCSLLEDLSEVNLPALILLENVVGFETSGSCQRWREVLSKRNYCVAHFHLSPPQVGLPNDRPRYYGIAVQSDRVITKDHDTGDSPLLRYIRHEDANMLQSPIVPHYSFPELQVTTAEESSLPPIGDFLDDTQSSKQREELALPKSLLNRTAAWCMDIVTSDSKQSACFTSSYGKFVRGTGSVLYTGNASSCPWTRVAPEERSFDPEWAYGMDLDQLRYFSGSEMARLLGFPETFSFPASCTLKQQWKLLGNSLNVRVAAQVTEFGLRLLRPKDMSSPTTHKTC